MPSPLSRRPNVIIITTDQQRSDSLGCYGAGAIETPNLDRMGSEGAVFRRAYCANPVCTPARASIFSGQYLTRHAAWNVGTSIPRETTFLSHRLGAEGYRTHYIGKAHFQAFGGGERSIESGHEWERIYAGWRGPYYGFETVELSLGHVTYGIRGHYGLWVKSQVTEADFQRYGKARRAGDGPSFGGEAYDWDLPTRLHNSVWTADRTVEFLENHDGRRPFFLSVGFQDPHHPHCVPADFADRVRPEDVSSPRYAEGELEDKPPHFKTARHGGLEPSRFRGDYSIAGQGAGFDYTAVTDRAAREGRAYYYSMVKLIDREMGRILDCLERRGLADDTLIVFTTDHGELLGDHGLWMKGPFHYEELIRIPFIVRWPGHIPANQSVDGLVSQVDIVPSVLAAAGLPIPADTDGVSFLPLLRSVEGSVRDHVVVECVDDPRRLRLKTIVTGNRKMTFYHGEPFGELYDLETDPGEIRNLWDDPEYREDKCRMMSGVADHLERLEPRSERYSYA